MTSRIALTALFSTLVLAGCTVETVDDGGGSDPGEPAPEGLPVLGAGSHEEAGVMVELIATAADGLTIPRDLQINPLRPEQLFVVNRDDESFTVITAPGMPEQTAVTLSSGGNEHFLAQPSALAMSDLGFFATAHETDEKTQGPNGTPEDFMGPTLWPSDTQELTGGHTSHYDMLHNSPNGMGIAWERHNVYWVFDGYHASITMYDFGGDHGPGGADHSDGVVRRYVEGAVARVPDVPSHMDFLRGTPLLHVADTGNARIAVLDITTGVVGNFVGPSYDGTDQRRVDGAVLTTLVDGVPIGMLQPSGLAIGGEHIYVSDAASSKIFGFDLEGNLVDWLQLSLPAGSLAGIHLDAEGRLYVADMLGSQVLRISALPGE